VLKQSGLFPPFLSLAMYMHPAITISLRSRCCCSSLFSRLRSGRIKFHLLLFSLSPSTKGCEALCLALGDLVTSFFSRVQQSNTDLPFFSLEMDEAPTVFRVVVLFFPHLTDERDRRLSFFPSVTPRGEFARFVSASSPSPISHHASRAGDAEKEAI